MQVILSTKEIASRVVRPHSILTIDFYLLSTMYCYILSVYILIHILQFLQLSVLD